MAAFLAARPARIGGMDEERRAGLSPVLVAVVILLLFLVGYGLAYRYEFSGTTYTIDNGPMMPNYWHDGPVIGAIFAPANAIDKMLRPQRWAAAPTPSPASTPASS
jgi:hypothetical protein